MTSIVRFVNSIPPAAIFDGFDRTETDGWGTVDGATTHMRPQWGTEGDAVTNYAVSAGTGQISVDTVDIAYRALISMRVVEVDETVTITIPVVATGGPIYLGLFALYASTSDNYKGELIFNTDNSVDVRIRKRVSDVPTTVASAPTGLTYNAGDRIKLRLQYTDGSTWRVKVWAAASTEPDAWTLTTTDTPTIGFGRIGVSATFDATNTNVLPVTVEYDDFAATPAPATRLDLMGCDPWSVIDGSDLSPPSLRRAVAQTMLRDGAVYPASAYDDRRITLRLSLKTASEDDSAAALHDLAVEVNRPTNFLKWQWEGMSHPVYFRTIRSDITKITEYQGVSCETIRTIDVDLLAEPFGIGDQQILAPLVVGNDPASGSARQQFDVDAADVLGDVDTPPILRMSAADIVGKQSLIAVRRRSLDGLFYALQAEDGTNQADTTEPGNDPVMSGGGNNYTRTTFATDATLVNRVTFAQFPPAPFVTTAYRGKYRVLLRYRKSVAGDEINVRLLWGGTTTTDAIVGNTVALVASTDRRYADLGIVTLPIGADPEHDGYSGLLWPATGVPAAIQAERVTGSGNLDMDIIVFVPADDRQIFVSWPEVLTGFGVVDGIDEMVYEQHADTPGTGPGPIGDALGIPGAGTFPLLSPDVDNRIYVLQDVGTTGAQDSITDTVSVTVDYWPRYLYVRAP